MSRACHGNTLAVSALLSSTSAPSAPMSLQPVVLASPTIPDLVQYVLERHSPPSTLVVCYRREEFLQLLRVTKHDDLLTDDPDNDESLDRQNVGGTDFLEQLSPFLQTPTLRLLSRSRTVKVAFCPDITHLRAHLSIYDPHTDAKTPHGNIAGRVPMLVILDPLQLHQQTSSYSAQGLSRTFATAVEAAHRAEQKLVIAECSPTRPPSADDEHAAGGVEVASHDPWDQEVSILNVTTKSFGAGERGWVGRTVKVKTIAKRWCKIESLSTSEATT